MDSTEAVKWFRKAAEREYGADATAQRNLGLCYEKGKGVAQNFAEAARWYRKAAEHKYGADADAQCSLGFCYYKGEGVPKDLEEAVKWFRKAAEQGHPNAKKVLELLKQ